MATTQIKTLVEGVESKEVVQEKRTRTFLYFFKTEWWEKISEKHMYNDIVIQTDRSIRSIILNGEIIILPHSR